MSEWISVEDKLPEPGMMVLAYNGSYYSAKVDYETSRKAWFETGGFDDIYNITHWMPLPGPPK